MVMTQRPVARILIADDHRLFADACTGILEPEFAVVGIVVDGRNLLDTALTLKPDVILLDISMPRLNGLDAGEQIKRKMPATRLIFLTMSMSPEVVADAFRRGASAYVTKQSAGVELPLAIRKVMRGESYLSPLVARETVTFLLNNKQQPLKEITQREGEVLQLLAEGMSMKQVADVLDVRPGTIAFHKYRMMEKLNIKTSAELITFAMKRQMIPSEKTSLKASAPD
jgi:DNA-binding NarL/FixJ family response regulator